MGHGRRALIPLFLAAALGAQAHETAPAVLAPGYSPLEFEAPRPGSYSLPVLGTAADAEVLDVEGSRLRLHELFDGRVVLLSFVFSSCSDINGCPLSLAVMHQLKSRIAASPELLARVGLVTLSFDPERDTPAVMKSYGAGARGSPTAWDFLTTESSRAVAPILAAYGQPVGREYDPQGQPTGRFSHVLRVFLIDGAQRIRNVYSSSFLHADLVLADIQTLLLESEAPVRAAVPARPPIDLLSIAEHPPLGLPPVPVPADNPLTRERIALGRKLFYDRRLSRNGTISCAMCHVPEQGFTSNELATAVGIEGRTVRRNSPTLYNVAYAERLFHDGREARLEQQIWGPLLARNEMGNPSVGYVLETLAALDDYDGLFEAAFHDRGPGMETLGMALAAYERTLLVANSPFDRWYYGGDAGALDPAAVRGFELFGGKAGCVVCHTMREKAALFSDQRMHNTGIGYARSMAPRPDKTRIEIARGQYVELESAALDPISEVPPADLGRYEITEDPADRWKYRTPTLRNVALTAPYMHDGSLRTLGEVVEFYSSGGVPNEALDPLLRPLGLRPEEVVELVAFLESLTGDGADRLVRDARSVPIGDPR